MTRRFHLDRTDDVSGVSGTGTVAEGVEFSDGTVAMRWVGSWPSSAVFHDEGIAGVVKIHGHDGATMLVWDDPPEYAEGQKGTVEGWPTDHRPEADRT